MATDFFKVRLWAVVGPPESGKSSTIGAMVSQTGRGRGGARDVLLRGGGWLHVQAYRRSVQEANRTPQVSLSKIMIAARARQRRQPFAYFNVLLALRSDVCNGLPTADHYLAEYVKNGWDLQSLVILDIPEDYNKYARFGAPTCLIEGAAENTSVALQRNWVFGQVRNHFGWA